MTVNLHFIGVFVTSTVLCYSAKGQTLISESAGCLLPSPPEHGTITTTGVLNAQPGVIYGFLNISVSCDEGYGVVGPSSVSCQAGTWEQSIPQCLRVCRLEMDPSMEYLCISANTTETRACNAYEPVGTVVSPRCEQFKFATTMQCIDGAWDNTARCKTECGRTYEQESLIIFGGRDAAILEFPWHAGIYARTFRPYQQICAGSLIGANVILSAAHCFYSSVDQQRRPTSEFAVAVGKQYRPWEDEADKDRQLSEVKAIHVPPRYQGIAGNFQDDIAVVITSVAFKFSRFTQPVCISFDRQFEAYQLQAGKKGVVAGWGLTGANGRPSPKLQVVGLPYVDISTCIQNSPANFRGFITSDKICAGTQASDIGLCKGDSGGGLAFPELTRGVKRYTLRGVVSSAPTSQDACNTEAYTSFTAISKHEYFIKEAVGDNRHSLTRSFDSFEIFWTPE